MITLFKYLFGCKHKRLTWPQSRDGRCYSCCLDCGAELLYAGALLYKRN